VKDALNVTFVDGQLVEDKMEENANAKELEVITKTAIADKVYFDVMVNYGFSRLEALDLLKTRNFKDLFKEVRSEEQLERVFHGNSGVSQ
jgi:hypothetical protein